MTRKQKNAVLSFLREGYATRQMKAPAVKPNRRGIRALLAIIRHKKGG